MSQRNSFFRLLFNPSCVIYSFFKNGSSRPPAFRFISILFSTISDPLLEPYVFFSRLYLVLQCVSYSVRTQTLGQWRKMSGRKKKVPRRTIDNCFGADHVDMGCFQSHPVAVEFSIPIQKSPRLLGRSCPSWLPSHNAPPPYDEFNSENNPKAGSAWRVVHLRSSTLLTFVKAWSYELMRSTNTSTDQWGHQTSSALQTNVEQDHVSVVLAGHL